MALITRICSSRGASVIFTINDLTQRGTLVETISLSRQMKVVIFDDQGAVLQTIIPTRNTTSSVVIDQPARLVQITKSDLTTKSYLSLSFAAYF